MKKFFVFSLIIPLALIFVMTSPLLAAGSASEGLKVGILLPLSGPAAPWGIGCLRGFEVMADKINEEGGIKVGDKTYQFELVKADTKTNADVALSQVNRLVFHEGVRYIGGPILSGCTLAIEPITEANKTVIMFFSDTPKGLGPDKKYSFRIHASISERIPIMYSYLRKYQPDVKTIAIIGPNDETGWGAAKLGKSKALQHGYEVIFEDFVQRGTTDFFPVLTKLIAKKPDAMLVLAFTPGMTALLVQQKHQLGYEGLVMSPVYYQPKMLLDKAGAEASEGFIFICPLLKGPTATEGHRELYKRYTEKYKEEFELTAVSSYPGLHILKLAIEKAGTIDSTAVARAMENLENAQHAYGRFSMGGLKTYGAKHQVIEPIFLGEIRNGEVVGYEPLMPSVP